MAKPTNLTEMNEELITYMNIFVFENWLHVPDDYVEKIVNFIDSLMIGKSFIKGSDFANLFIDVDLKLASEKADQINALEQIKLYVLSQKINKQVEEKNQLKTADFYDSCALKLKKYLKSIKDIDLNLIRPKKDQKSDFLGYSPSGGFFNLQGYIKNDYVEYKLSQMGQSYYFTLAKIILSYKLACYADIQTDNVKKISETIDDFNIEKVDEILDKSLVNPAKV